MSVKLLYIPGFQEDLESDRSPGNQLQSYFGEESIIVGDIPGDTTKNQNTKAEFSMTALKYAIREQIISILDSQEGVLNIITYSLSARPVLDAISEFMGEYKSRIKLFLIHPAYNPLHAVKVMDWIRTDEFQTPQNTQYYLKGDVVKIFNKLIKAWKGNGEEFQNDLLNYDAVSFENLSVFQTYCSSLGFTIEIIGEKIGSDKVIHQRDNEGNLHTYCFTNKLRVQLSHGVKLSEETLSRFAV